MARKRENVFIEQVHKHLPGTVYAEKTHNPYRRGIPDVYYEAPGNVLWVEYKWLPKRPSVLRPLEIKDFTKLQQLWLKRAHDNGQPVALIVGSPLGATICPGIEWLSSLNSESRTNREVAEWLTNSLSTMN